MQVHLLRGEGLARFWRSELHRLLLRSFPQRCFTRSTPPIVAPARQVHALTQEMKARGERVVSLCVGEPDFQPPPAVIEATSAAAKKVTSC